MQGPSTFRVFDGSLNPRALHTEARRKPVIAIRLSGDRLESQRMVGRRTDSIPPPSRRQRAYAVRTAREPREFPDWETLLGADGPFWICSGLSKSF